MDLSPRLHAENLRANGGKDWLLVVTLVLWLLLVLTGGRMPWEAIPEKGQETSNAAIRQLVFTGAAGLAFWRLLCTKTIARVFFQHPFMIALVTYTMSTCLWSAYPTITLKRSIIMAFGMTVLMTAVHRFKNPFATMQRIMVYTIGFVVLGSIVGMQIFPKNCWELELREGLAGWTLHPNTLGPVCGIGLILALGTVAKNPQEKALLILLRLVLPVGLLLTGSMTSITFTLQGLFIYSLLCMPNYERTAATVVLMVLGSVVAIVGVGTVMAMFLEAMGRDASLTGRTDVWAAVLKSWATHPFLGEGYGAFWVEADKGRQLVKTWNPRQAHNGYLDVLNENGLIGMALLLLTYHASYLSMLPRFCARAADPRRRMLASAVSTCIVVTVIYSFGETCLMKFDTVPFFTVSWLVLILANPDTNNHELLQTPTDMQSFLEPDCVKELRLRNWQDDGGGSCASPS